MGNPRRIRVTQVASQIGELRNTKACLQGLGLRRIGHTIELEDSLSIRGMISRVRHLIRIEEDIWDWTRLSEMKLCEMTRREKALTQIPLNHVVPIYIADTSQFPNDDNISSGTGSLIRLSNKNLCITNLHVLKEFRTRYQKNERVRFYVGRVQLDPDKLRIDSPDMLVIAESDSLDLVVMDMNCYTSEEISYEGDKSRSFIEFKSWPPRLPVEGSYVMFCGFPKQLRHASCREVTFQALSSGGSYVYQASSRNIICRVEEDRDFRRKAKMPIPQTVDLPGISGGIVLQERHFSAGLLMLDVVGFVCGHNENYDTLLIRSATCLRKDGTLDEDLAG